MNALENSPYVAENAIIFPRSAPQKGQRQQHKIPEKSADGMRRLNRPQKSETSEGRRRPMMPAPFMTDRV